jgi:hypothetical protein
MPRIDIIHMRDPDSSCDHEVYLDGVPVTYKDDLHFWSYDPGAGYDLNEVEEKQGGRHPIRTRLPQRQDRGNLGCNGALV